MLIHGHATGGKETREYRTWTRMLERCANPKRRDYHNYGGRGIQVCERWKVFANFLADMGPKPVGMSIDRKDNNGNYELRNCRWATPLEQAANRRNSILARVSLENIFTTLLRNDWNKQAAAREIGISDQSLRYQIKRLRRQHGLAA